MSVDLSEYTDVLRREVTPADDSQLGVYSDDTLTGYMADAFWEAYLDAVATGASGASAPLQAMLLPYSCDIDGIVTPNRVGDPDLNRAAIALVVLYAGLKVLRNQLINNTSSTRIRAKAGPVEYESDTASSANLLTEMAKQLQAVKDRLLSFEDEATATIVIDAYGVRQWFVPFSEFGGYAGYVGDVLYEALGSGSLQLVNLGGEGV